LLPAYLSIFLALCLSDWLRGWSTTQLHPTQHNITQLLGSSGLTRLEPAHPPTQPLSQSLGQPPSQRAGG